MSRSRTPLYAELSSLVQAIGNLRRREDLPPHIGQHIGEHEESIAHLVSRYMPQGSGFDRGMTLDVDASLRGGLKLVFHFEYHHMDEHGGYTGWTSHALTVVPTFKGIELHISGRDRNQIKEYLYDTLRYHLTQEVWQDENLNWCSSMHENMIQCLCPLCGEKSLRYIESVNSEDEVKHIYSADCECDMLVYLIPNQGD